VPQAIISMETFYIEDYSKEAIHDWKTTNSKDCGKW
jgi:hypothetical protein